MGKLVNLFRGKRARLEEDLDRELQYHVDRRAAELMAAGVSEREAKRRARLELGGVAQVQEGVRETWIWRSIDELLRDVRYGLRGLRRTPGFTAVALITLALGIGANAAIFSIVNAVILKPLAYPNPGQLMRLTAHFSSAGPARVGLSHPEYVEFREMNRSFAHVGAFTTGRGTTGGGSGAWAGEVNLTAGDRPLRVRSAAVDDHLLRALGVQPAQGRLFAPGETDAMPARPGLGGPPLAILSHELWQSAFNGQPMVGEAVSVDGRPHDVIGIMPAGIDLLDSRPEIWLPIGVHPVIRQLRSSHVLSVIGRLKDGVTPEAAHAELNAFLDNWGERAGTTGHVPLRHTPRPDDHTLQLRPLQEAIVGDAGRAIWVLQAAVGFILLIGCANLASLAMARSESRRREFAVRTALGASRGRLLRQTMAEGVLLSVAGGALGLWIAHAGVKALVLAYPTSLPRTGDVAIDGSVLLFALAISIGTGLLFGLAPVVQGATGDLMATFKEGGSRGASGGGRRHIRRALVVAEVALAMMLATSAGLLLRSVYNLTRVDAGFDRSRLVTFSMTLPRGVAYTGGRAQIYERLLGAIRVTPGVQSATAMSDLPLNRFVQGYTTRIDDSTAAAGYRNQIVDYYQFVKSEYFATLGIPIVAGRGFEPRDAASLERVAIVNETLANRLWAGRNPIGQRIRPSLNDSMGTSSNPWHQVIGVARDVKEGGVDRPTGTELYLFLDQPGPPVDGTEAWVVHAPLMMNLALRTSLPPAALAQTLRAAVRDLDPAVPIVRLRDMEAVFAESIRQPRLLAQLLGAFAALALLLAAVGTYGVLAYMATERRREIGIRMALGAARSSVIVLVMKQGLVAAITGVILGVAGALAANRLMTSLLFGVRPNDAVTMAAVVATLMLVAAIACWLPAWRASRVDPNVVLRAD